VLRSASYMRESSARRHGFVPICKYLHRSRKHRSRVTVSYSNLSRVPSRYSPADMNSEDIALDERATPMRRTKHLCRSDKVKISCSNLRGRFDGVSRLAAYMNITQQILTPWPERMSTKSQADASQYVSYGMGGAWSILPMSL
jgi:hypothetical protein